MASAGLPFAAERFDATVFIAGASYYFGISPRTEVALVGCSISTFLTTNWQ
jgi:hypothetical protein